MIIAFLHTSMKIFKNSQGVLPLAVSVLLLGLFFEASAQVDIAWQKSLGTPYTDNGLQVFPDEQGNSIVIGKETHADFAGNIREYMMVAKFDPAGNELWKTYHDVAFNTFSLPVDYTVGRHFYTEEFGDTLLNLVISIYDRILQYKIIDRSGQYYFYEEITADIIDVDRQNEKVYANVRCSIQQSCYGPDSLIVQKFDPTPDSLIFDPVEWTFEMKQDFRTAPIQGHYDFDIQDIRMDGAGNTYLLVQIERWDFQFCTDCADAFIDAWCEVFKFDAGGQLLDHVNLKTARAVVSNMRFISLSAEGLTVQINDINAAGTKVLTSVYRLDDDLSLLKKFDMDEAYYLIQADKDNNLVTCRNIFDENDPEIKGLSDALVSTFDPDGVLLWRRYFGGSSWDFPRALSIAGDGSIYFLADSESTDFDVTENFGGQDIWFVKLTEGGSTLVGNDPKAGVLSIFPNPTADYFQVNTQEPIHVDVFDAQGRAVLSQGVSPQDMRISLSSLPQGVYTCRGVNDAGQVFNAMVVKVD
jgi:hypothetical protein